jgi:hypothetical protein
MSNIVDLFCKFSEFVTHFGSYVNSVFFIANKPANDKSLLGNQKHMNSNLVISESRRWQLENFDQILIIRRQKWHSDLMHYVNQASPCWYKWAL